jgi:hypothetical protein
MAHMGEAARRKYEEKYCAEINYRKLMNIYDYAMRKRTMNAF